ncbi:MAG: DUF1700 domain-containing protein [Acholeplasma sp.]|nr:MAG: DUF1700 domain-containing protein [Acholeplasma sp.]
MNFFMNGKIFEKCMRYWWNERMHMKTWLKDLERALSKKFYDSEVDDIVSYYEEMINERLSSGESLDQILASYDIQKIVVDMTPEVLMKRENNSYRKISKSTKQLLILLIGSPILFPLAVLYISIMIVVFSMILTGFVVLGSSLIGFIGFLTQLSTSSLSLGSMIGMIGFALVVFTLMAIFSLVLLKWMTVLQKKLLHWFSKLAYRKGEEKWKYFQDY